MEELLAAVAERGLEHYILSSQPLPEHADRLQVLASQAEWLSASADHELQWSDIERVLAELRAAGKHVMCCICVWEGYRSLMAQAKLQLGVPDVWPEQVALLRNKFLLRKTLYQASLSRVSACPVTSDNLSALQRSGRRLFVKPVRGI